MPDQRDNAGTLSRNKKRETDRQPEFRGSLCAARMQRPRLTRVRQRALNPKTEEKAH
jgi:hypothetical protein